jgi:hypothetical protein
LTIHGDGFTTNSLFLTTSNNSNEKTKNSTKATKKEEGKITSYEHEQMGLEPAAAFLEKIGTKKKVIDKEVSLSIIIYKFLHNIL